MKAEGIAPDVLTFAGNGEPTAHPDFAAIIDDTLLLRDRHFPQAKVSVLTNATRIILPEVHKALMKIDNNIVKLDTVDVGYISRVDRPTGKYDLNAIIDSMRAFEGHCVVQTMFMKGNIKDKEGNYTSVDNCKDEYIQPYIEALKKINPKQVMIYTLDREWPTEGLEKVDKDTMDTIAQKLRNAGFDTSVSY